MNWIQILTDLREVMTLDEIAQAVGMQTRGHVHNVCSGRQRTVSYEVGVKIVALRKEHSREIAAARRRKKPNEQMA